MTVIRVHEWSIYVNGRCVQDDARTRDAAVSEAASIQASLAAIGQDSQIVYGEPNA